MLNNKDNLNVQVERLSKSKVMSAPVNVLNIILVRLMPWTITITERSIPVNKKLYAQCIRTVLSQQLKSPTQS